MSPIGSELGVRSATGATERARISREIGTGDLGQVARALRLFRTIMMLSWGGTGVVAVLLLLRDPRLIFPADYTVETLAIGAALWMATAFVRLWRTPESVLLQAGNAFRALALASVWSAAISVVVVTVLLLTAPPLWSLLGIVFGETVCAALIFRAARTWCGRAAAHRLSPLV